MTALATTHAPSRRVGAGALYVFSMAALAAVAAWPIYRSGAFVAIVVAGVVAGAVVAVTGASFAWRGWLTAVVTAGVVVVLGVVLAVPRPGADLAGAAGAVADVLSGAVLGWKDLITVELPVGAYRNLLVPALIVFVVGTVSALRLAWSGRGFSTGAVAVAIAMVVFGIAFGRPSTSAPLLIGEWAIPAPVETLVGVLSVLFSLAWLAGHARQLRREALRRAASGTGLRVSRRRAGSDGRRAVLAGVMVVSAVALGAIAGPVLAQTQAREVLRSGVDPLVAITQAVSPLSQYRSIVTTEAEDDLLFRVAPGDQLPERIRIATLTDYDGEIYRSVDAEAGPAQAPFVRIPSARDAGAGDQVSMTVTIDTLRGIWLPTTGRVQGVVFSGDNAASLADSFYYSSESQAAVQTTSGGLRQGDGYTVSAVVPSTPPLSAISAPGSPPGAIAPPESLVAWLEQQQVSADGAGLAEAIARLRERGYLSHALAASTEDPPAWMSELDGYAFEPSPAGHSLARIDTMFQRLLAREADAGGDADADASGQSLVAAVGDDEQFAVATALIAEQLGFPSRVVVGARLDSADAALPVCERGECRATDLSAWVEVRSSEGDWVSVDVTPQHALPIDTDVSRQRDPQVVTEVRPETAEEVVAPEPVRQQAAAGEDDAPVAADLSALWAALRVAGLSALGIAIVLGPFITVVGAKALRRRRRRADGDPSARVLGGWDEFVDAAVDHGHPAPGAQTRAELAALYGTPQSPALARDADHAAFSRMGAGEAVADAYWSSVDDERRALGIGVSWWRRALAAVSLKSFTRSLVGPLRGRRPSAAGSERGMRRPPGHDARASS